MPSYQKIIALLLLLFATAAFAPKPPIPGNPQITCIIKDQKDPRDTYIIRGRNWNITEAEFKDAINTDDLVLSAWEWKSAVDDEGAQVFKAKVSGKFMSWIKISQCRQLSKKTMLMCCSTVPVANQDC